MSVSADRLPTARGATSEPARIKTKLYLSSGIVAFSGWLFGFDTGSIGPVTTTPSFYRINASLQGVIVATILITAFCTSFLAGPLADKVSRRTTISAGTAIFATGSAICLAAQSLGMFVAGRAIAGTGEGLFLSVAGTWLVEVAPAQKRGQIAALQQLFIATGLAAGYFVSYGSLRAPGTWQWRIPFACQAFIGAAIAALVQTPLVPESPRWLVLHARSRAHAMTIVDAFALDARTAETEREHLLHWADQEHRLQDAQSDHRPLSQRLGLSGIHQCWQKQEQRRWKTTAGIVLLGIQQLSGIDAILFYAPTIFASAGLSSDESSFLASGVSGIVGVVVSVPAQIWMVEKAGRRSTTIVGGLILGICMLIIGILFASKSADRSSTSKHAIIGLIYVFVATYCATWSIVIKIYVSEVQPSRTRASANGLAQASNWLVNIAIALGTPPFLQGSRPAVYLFFGAFCFIGAFLGVLMFETKGLSTAGIEEAWDKRQHQLERWRRRSTHSSSPDIALRGIVTSRS